MLYPFNQNNERRDEEGSKGSNLFRTFRGSANHFL